jgi:hypothetical protein
MKWKRAPWQIKKAFCAKFCKSREKIRQQHFWWSGISFTRLRWSIQQHHKMIHFCKFLNYVPLYISFLSDLYEVRLSQPYIIQRQACLIDCLDILDHFFPYIFFRNHFNWPNKNWIFPLILIANKFTIFNQNCF